MKLLDDLEKRIRPFAVQYVLRYIIAFQIVIFILAIIRPPIIDGAALVPSLVLQGEVWRLVSFMFLPPVAGLESSFSVLWAIIYWQLLWLFGSSLEAQWGAARFNLFLLIGYVATVSMAFIGAADAVGMQNQYLYMTTFLAFARLFPNFTLHLMFILPVKVRWLALFVWIMMALDFLQPSLMTKLSILAAVSNYLLFFGGEIIAGIKQRKRRAKHVAEAKAVEEMALHTCSVCGASEQTHPTRDFRYDDDGTCYCEEHLA